MNCPTCNGTGELPTGAQMRKLRGALSQTAIAKKMRVSKSYLSDLENDRRRFTAARERDFRRAVERLTKS